MYCRAYWGVTYGVAWAVGRAQSEDHSVAVPDPVGDSLWSIKVPPAAPSVPLPHQQVPPAAKKQANAKCHLIHLPSGGARRSLDSVGLSTHRTHTACRSNSRSDLMAHCTLELFLELERLLAKEVGE